MNYTEEYQRWLLSPALSEAEWKELTDISEDENEIKSRFYSQLQFGTAGLRGIMGTGLNRMNIHVIRHVTHAFASVIRGAGEDAMSRGVVICFDCRRNSREFAMEAASVMAGNGIHVRLFESLRPTPELSFAIRHYKAEAGLNITASHNPKEYNGYKVYWSDGAQLPPGHAEAIAKSMEKIDIFSDFEKADFDEALRSGMIEYIGSETDELFLENVLAQAINPQVVSKMAEDFKIVYTPFHGTGYRLVPEVLKRLGVKMLYPVEEQMVLDGDFPTVNSPNPENPEGFYLAIELAKKVGSDLIIGTDPDADRIGVMVRAADGNYKGISGNQMGVLLLEYIITSKRANGTLPDTAAAIKTIVTTEMARAVAEKNAVHIVDTFTGFKFMAEKIAEFERTGDYEYIFAYEESYGYMMGSYVRDKDAVTAAMMIAEMAAFYYSKNMTLLDAIESLYLKYGRFCEETINLVMPGIDGLEKMKALMDRLRSDPPSRIAGTAVLRQRDYLNGTVIVPGLGMVGETEIKGSDVLYFELEDSSSFIIRPSGTEPKIKVYILVSGSGLEECKEKTEKYTVAANELG